MQALEDEAAQAEAVGDYLRAVEVLTELQTASPDPVRLLRLARCHLLAGQWQFAADAYRQSGSMLPAVMYNTGFALAKSGDFVSCLRHWQPIDCSAEEFLAQKTQISTLLIHELHSRLDKNPIAQETEVRQLIEEFSLHSVAGGSELLARCGELRLVRLWQEEQTDAILSLTDAVNWLHPAVLEIQAKAACRKMEEAESISPAEVRHCIDCWLTLLFHPHVGPQDELLRQTLLEFGAEAVRRQAMRQPPDCSDSLLQQWEETLGLLRYLNALTVEVPAYAPALALRAGIAAPLCALIRNNKESFSNEQAWTAAGAVYSDSARALLLIRDGNNEAALSALNELETQLDDPFVAWGAAEVRTACGIHFLRRGSCREAEQILNEGPAHWTAALEKELLAVLDNDDDQDGQRLVACLGILALLPAEAGETRAAFCTALTDQVVRLRSSEKAHPRLLAMVMEQALALHPDDELAQTIFDQICLDVELTSLNEAFDRDCVAEAARIAAASRFSQTVEHFFEAARHVAAQIERGDYSDQEAAIFRLEELLASVSKVDATHGAVRRIRRALDGLRLERK